MAPDELRLSLTLLPVGPRGSAVVASGRPLWFALQVSAGFKENVPPDRLGELWPWFFQDVITAGEAPDSKVMLHAWRMEPTQATDLGPASSPLPEFAGFGDALQSQIESGYAAPPAGLHLQLLFPSELPADPEEHLANSFVTRVAYLGALPGAVSQRLLATLYFTIDRDALFEPTADGADWQPVGGASTRLWVAPAAIRRPDGTLPLQGVPAAAVKPLDELFTQSYDATTAAFGPGFELARLLDPPQNLLFDLEKFWLPVASGDDRFAKLEAFLLRVLDPFSELSLLRSDLLAGVISTGGRLLAAEEFRALRELWGVAELVALLDRSSQVVARSVDQLARRLGAGDTLVGEVVAAIPDDRRPDLSQPGSILGQLQVIARLLRLREAGPRELLRAGAARCELTTVVDWLAGAFSEALDAAHASDPASLKKLRSEWRPPDAAERLVRERQSAIARIVLDELLEQRWVAPLLATLAGAHAQDVEGRLHDDVRKALKDIRWRDRLQGAMATALADLGFQRVGADLGVADEVLFSVVDDFLGLVWQLPEGRRENAAEPITLIFGGAPQRLVHAKNDDPDVIGTPAKGGTGGVLDEVTGHLLLARRHHDREALKAQPWKLVSGGVALVGHLEDAVFEPGVAQPWLDELLPIAEENVFANGVLRADRGYEGALRHVQSPLELAYNAEAHPRDEAEQSIPAPLTYQGIGLFAGQPGMDEKVAMAKAPPLRYGDFYQFAAGIVDAAGGIPREIAVRDAPWRLAVTPFSTDLPSSSQPIPYRRRQSVGEINVLPGEVSWPQTDAGVALRAREWWNARPRGSDEPVRADNLPEVLLCNGPDFASTAPSSRFTAYLEPPIVDEFTLRRWVTPEKGAPDTDTVRKRLTTALANLHSLRNRGDDQRRLDKRSIVHDPAVTALGVRVRIFDATGGCPIDQKGVVALREADPENTPFRIDPVALELSALAPAAVLPPASALFPGGSVRVALPPGHFACIEVWPLVAADAFARRFADLDFFSGLVDATAPFDGYVAFEASALLYEAATSELPDPEQLYDQLRLSQNEADGQVVVSFERPDGGGEVRGLSFVDSYTLERERWVWRSRPVLVPEELGDADPAERRRLLASGLPSAAFSEERRDDDPVLRSWERLASLDRGFADRGSFSARWPRAFPDAPLRAGGPQSGVTLLLDDRDGSNAATYLRFGLRVRSRYAPLLLPRKQVVAATWRRENDPVEPAGRVAETWRRIAVAYRGAEAKPKPPKILSVVPLTRGLEQNPLQKHDSTPFLVLLDETWFREYGIGERLEARLALENQDIGEPDTCPRPRRVGPLPDHYLPRASGAPIRYFRNETVTDDDDDRNPVLLEAFGPFGYSLDASPDEAFPNASAFVVDLPRDVGPHWAAFARFQRLLDLPPEHDGARSDWSDVYGLYTLPDAGTLALPTGRRPRVEIGKSADRYAAQTREMTWQLDPIPGQSDWPRHGDSRAAVRANYRYFLLVCRPAANAGQPREVDVPVELLRIRSAKAEEDGRFALDRLGTHSGEPGPGRYRGRLLEVLVNGKYASASHLDGELSVRQFWDRVLTVAKSDGPVPAVVHDAAGIVRRVSAAFELEWTA